MQTDLCLFQTQARLQVHNLRSQKLLKYFINCYKREKKNGKKEKEMQRIDRNIYDYE